MSEHIKVHAESSERHIPVHEAKKHHERLQSEHEKSAEKSGRSVSHEQTRARHEVQEKAISGAEYHKPQSENRQPTPPLDKESKAHAFETIMHHNRQYMTKTEQTFSKIIHKPAVEKASEIAGKTVARPSGIAGAAIAAFIGLFSVYSVAKFAGFQLSGSEMPLLLVAGFGLGLVSEWIFKATRSIFKLKTD